MCYAYSTDLDSNELYDPKGSLQELIHMLDDDNDDCDSVSQTEAKSMSTDDSPNKSSSSLSETLDTPMNQVAKIIDILQDLTAKPPVNNPVVVNSDNNLVYVMICRLIASV